eukprot:1186598-Prorocentrum_minimum.AAC.4
MMLIGGGLMNSSVLVNRVATKINKSSERPSPCKNKNPHLRFQLGSQDPRLFKVHDIDASNMATWQTGPYLIETKRTCLVLARSKYIHKANCTGIFAVGALAHEF